MQLSFIEPEKKIRNTLEIASKRDYDIVIGMVSGGTDSLCAIDAYHRFHHEYHLPPIDLVVQTNTGTTLPQTLETAREFCAERGIPYIEVRNKTPGRMLAHRILEHGWPTHSQGGPEKGGHWPEFINRKLDTWDKVYSSFSGQQLWISGGRVAESDRRARNLGDGAVDFGETGDRQPRKTWVAPIHGFLDEEKQRYIEEHDIPRTIAYDFIGYSGDCTACAFDDPRVLNEISILSPELAYALSVLVVWTYMRIRRGEINQPLERCVWGTEIEDSGEDAGVGTNACQRSLRWGGCSEPDCPSANAAPDGGVWGGEE